MIVQIPKEILTIYPKLVAVDPMNRPSYDIVTSTLREQGYFGNDLEKTMTSLSQYHILDDFQRIAFLEKLPNLLETYPKNIALYNVLPSLLEMFNYVKEQKIIFPSMIKVIKMFIYRELKIYLLFVYLSDIFLSLLVKYHVRRSGV